MIPLCLVFLGAVPPAGVDIVFPTTTAPVRLRVEVRVDDHSPEIAWEAFLDKLFDYFDRNGDGFISAAEAGRVFPLPLSDGREAKMDYARLNANKDGNATRTEFRAFYRMTGFSSVVAIIRPQTAEQRRLSDALFRHLDLDGDGTLSRSELGKAAALLRRFDENEDEVLESGELLALEPTGRPISAKANLSLASATDTPDGALRLGLGKASLPVLLETNSPHLKAGRDALHFSVADRHAAIHRPSTEYERGFRTAKEFYFAQFTEALGIKTALRKADIESDAGLQAIAGMFDAADCNDDDKLTLTELKAFLELIELGVDCQVTVTIEDRGENLFDLLDTNDDGHLDLSELNRAVNLSQIERTKIPKQFRIGISRGPLSNTFGPVPIPKQSSKASVLPAMNNKGARWFKAMDQNDDGFISAAEFRGRADLFTKLDRDGDGRISVAEAESYSKK